MGRESDSRCLFTSLTLAALCCLTSGARAQIQSGDPSGMVKVVRGDVQALRGEQATPLHIGDHVFQGDHIQTSHDAAVGITLRDDTLMSLGPDTRFILEQYQFNSSAGDGNIAARIVRGTLRYVTGLIGKHAPQHQQVMTPTATIGIRGTDFIVEVADE